MTRQGDGTSIPLLASMGRRGPEGWWGKPRENSNPIARPPGIGHSNPTANHPPRQHKPNRSSGRAKSAPTHPFQEKPNLAESQPIRRPGPAAPPPTAGDGPPRRPIARRQLEPNRIIVKQHEANAMTRPVKLEPNNRASPDERADEARTRALLS